MFTGIIQATAKIKELSKLPNLLRYTLDFPDPLLEGLQLGASVSVNGVCQTVVSIEGNDVTFEAIAETLKCTTCSTFTLDQTVNIERSAKLGDEIGGHLLSGHIIGMARIQKCDWITQEQCVLTLACNPQWMKYILPKGYIALNGASLTVVEISPKGECTVHLIPQTLKMTTFGQAKTDQLVNVEIDSQTQAIVATVEKILAQSVVFKENLMSQ